MMAAMDACNEALRLDPENPAGYFAIAVVYSKMGLKEKADEAMQQFREKVKVLKKPK